MVTGSNWNKRQIIVLFIFFTSTLMLFTFNGCSRQITGASFAQKNSNPIEIVTETSIPEQSSPFSAMNTAGIDRYLPLVKKYSQQYGMDWVLVLALIKQESRFDHEAVSHRGAYGLMQIMPLTQIELAEKIGLDEANTPRNNIKAGIYHLKSLYMAFNGIPHEDRVLMTLAAYNAGLGRILDAQRIATYLGYDSRKWSSVQSCMPFLSKKSYTLHSRVWEDGYPPSGYFRDYRQTIDYVDNIRKSYDRYSLALK